MHIHICVCVYIPDDIYTEGDRADPYISSNLQNQSLTNRSPLTHVYTLLLMSLWRTVIYPPKMFMP